jgi:universal stress protein E
MNQQHGYSRILVATDFSACAAAALKQAIWLASQTGAQIIAANAVPDLSGSVFWSSSEIELYQKLLCDKSEASLRQWSGDASAAGLNVTCKTMIGEPFAEIARAVQTEACDLVLAGTRGHSTWEQLFAGSTTKRLVRKCPSAVWIAKAEHVGAPKVVLAATDFSDVSLKAVKQGLWIARQSGASFHLMHVMDSNDVPEDVISMIPPGSSLRQEIEEVASRRMEEFLKLLDTNQQEIQTHQCWGSPWQEICRVAAEESVDLLVMGTVGRSGITGVLLGNTAERILDRCDCSILTVKPDGFVSPILPVA